ncbi:hypothetical protein VTN00DRAFT_3974 [Thermoascus crustaceus]|uniref:uncharacterized protein n=1 Tax=Thermoascus crustaceus TaxID=5088 RepID=UPI003742C472
MNQEEGRRWRGEEDDLKMSQNSHRDSQKQLSPERPLSLAEFRLRSYNETEYKSPRTRTSERKVRISIP